MIRIESLTHHYPQQTRPALDQLTAEIASGSITGLVGPTGSGKTTLSRILAGLLPPVSGRIIMDEQPTTPEQRTNSVALADSGEGLSAMAAQHVLMFAQLRPTWDQAVYDRLAERFHLVAKGALKRRSQGERALFMASIVMASGAPVTILDEVTSGLDVPTRLALYEEVIRVAAETDRTFLVASHLVAELEALAENLIVLNAGRLQLARSVETIRGSVVTLHGPRHAVEELLRERPEPPARVLSMQELGRFTHVQVLDAPQSVLDAAHGAGIHVTPLTFQDTFVSLISEEPS